MTWDSPDSDPVGDIRDAAERYREQHATGEWKPSNAPPPGIVHGAYAPFAAAAEPTYSFFDLELDQFVHRFEFPTVGVKSGPIVYDRGPWAPAPRHRRRRWVELARLWWWPARIRRLEAEVAYLRELADLD